MRRLVWLGLLLWLGAVPTSHAQTPVVDGCMSAAVTTVPGTGPIAVTNAAGGVQVLAANGRRCGAMITNMGTVTMNCASSTTTPTATVGTPVASGATYTLGAEGRQAYRCISTTATATAAAITEAVMP